MRRLDRIVVGIDFTEPSMDALRWSTTHLAPDGRQMLAHVVEPAEGPGFLVPPQNLANIGDAVAVAASGTRLREVARDFPGALSTHVLVGLPSEELVRFARREGAGLVVVGACGESRPDKEWLGSTAERLAGAAPPPVLIVRRAPTGPPRQILVAVDDAAITRTVLSWAAFLSERFAAELTLLHVLPNAAITHVASLAAATSREVGASEREVEHALITEGARWLESMALAGANPQAVRTDIRFGRAGDVIIERASALPAHLLVIGRHGRTAIHPTRLGRTVRSVLHGATCPVLVVGADE
ncbi:MAG: universal stress protein [Gemmatimonadaceae bacterium]